MQGCFETSKRTSMFTPKSSIEIPDWTAGSVFRSAPAWWVRFTSHSDAKFALDKGPIFPSRHHLPDSSSPLTGAVPGRG
jgi:hypothetical protein